MNLPNVLDREFVRVAKSEGIPVDDLMEEVAALSHLKIRQLYNYRSGKQVIPATLIPIFCKRFKSRALLHALEAACNETLEVVPDGYDVTRLVTQTVRDTLNHYEKYLDAFEDGVITKQELDELMSSGDRVAQSISQFKAIAVEDYERRQRFPKTR